MRTEFVDRAVDLRLLRTVATELGERRGSALVFEGRSGIGKSELLRRFVGELDSGALRAVRTSCRAYTGQGFPFGPIIDILTDLGSGRDGRRAFGRLAKRAGRGAVHVAPDVLFSLVPALTPLAPVVRSVAEAALGSGQLPGDSLQQFQQAIALRVAEQIRQEARAGRPVVLIIDDVQFIDDSSLQVIDLLVQKLEVEPMAVVLSLTTGLATGAPSRDLSQLVTGWARAGLVQRRIMENLPSDAVAELVGLRYQSPPPEFSARLTEVTGGLPLFVRLCLDQWNPEDEAEMVLPDTVAEVVRIQLGALEEQDRRLVFLAAIQGPVFLSEVLARSASIPHEDVLERLRVLALDRTLIKVVDKPDWAVAEATDAYSFDHLLLWDAVYHAQTDEQRRARHEQVALVLSGVVEEYDDAPLGMRLELARQLELGGAPCAEACADVRLALARSAALGGLSFAEAELHCSLAIAAAEAMRPGRARDRRLVEAIEMLLSMTEVRWHGRHQPADGSRNIDALAVQAEEAAAREGSASLIAATTLLRGKTLLATEGVERALDKLSHAVDLADGLQDPARAYVARVEYGRQLGKRDLAAALEVLREAERMYLTDPGLSDSGDFVLQHARNLGEMQLAVNLFDSGYIDDALGRLLVCVDRLRRAQVNPELPIALNYLAQVQLAVGKADDAELTLREALAFEEERGGESGWHAYNGALLASKLSMDRRTQDESTELIEQAWHETQGTWLINLVPIVRNLYAEVLLATGRNRPDDAQAEARALNRAEDLARETCLETEESGMVRSQIAALSLRARIHLRVGRSTQAAHFARESVRILEGVGDMPALRTEEVLYYAATVLSADGDEAEARSLLERARSLVAEKAARIQDPALRHGFLYDVPLNRWIDEGLGC